MPQIPKPYDENVGIIKQVEFSILSPDEILKNSVCEVNKPFNSTNKSLEGTLSDPRMGPISNDISCKTCNLKYKDCPGHFGHIKLKVPVLNILYVKYIIKILNIVCSNCSGLLINTNYNLFSNKNRFLKSMKMKTSNDCCNICNESISKYKFESGKVTKSAKKSKEENIKQDVNSEDILRILSAISDEDCWKIGLNPKSSRPEWMIFTYLPVAPPSVRPSVKTDTGKVAEDDLTHKYIDIIKQNDKTDSSSSDKDKVDKSDNIRNTLFWNVNTLIDNKMKPVCVHKNGRPIKSLSERQRGKHGRYRMTLMGKRVDGSARSVIICNDKLSIDEVGVPEEILRTIPYPETVNKNNIGYLTKLVNENGAKSYERNGKKMNIDIILKNKKKNNDTNPIELRNDDIVYRFLIKGDMVIFNRQPSLHKMSMMSHKVVPVKTKAFQLSANVTGPYNADFDGDEMNMHIVQSYETISECKQIINVANQIVSPQSSKPVIGLVQDSVLGAYLFTKEKYINEIDYFNITRNLYTFNSAFAEKSKKNDNGITKYSVSAILSGIMPFITYKNIIKEDYISYEDIKLIDDYNNFTEPIDINDQQMVSVSSILSGIAGDDYSSLKNKINDIQKQKFIIKGKSLVIKNCIVNNSMHRLDKKSLGTGAGGLIHIIFNDCGPDSAKDFINNISIIAIEWLKIIGFSTSIRDCYIDNDIHKKNKDQIENKLNESYKLIKSVKFNIFDNDNDKEIKTEELYIKKLRSIVEQSKVDTEKITIDTIKDYDEEEDI